MRYVLSDIHGEFDKFMLMLDKINFSKDDVMYILGDVIDRGEKSIELLKFIKSKNNINFLLGNHEYEMLNYFNNKPNCWFDNGGFDTYKELIRLPQSEFIDILNFIETRPMYHIEDNYILVHGGLKIPRHINVLNIEIFLSKQIPDTFLWIREKFFTKQALENYTIIFGHTPTYKLYRSVDNINPPIPFSIWYDKKYKDKIGIDCGAVFSRYGGRLGCLRLDDMKEFYT